jgi:excisionase family DNA binding protein
MIAKSALIIDLNRNSKPADDVLIQRWFSLSEKERGEHFIESITASRLAAVSQRTIRIWIEYGYIRAIRIGKKYHIELESLKQFIIRGTKEIGE